MSTTTRDSMKSVQTYGTAASRLTNSYTMTDNTIWADNQEKVPVEAWVIETMLAKRAIQTIKRKFIYLKFMNIRHLKKHMGRKITIYKRVDFVDPENSTLKTIGSDGKEKTGVLWSTYTVEDDAMNYLIDTHINANMPYLPEGEPGIVNRLQTQVKKVEGEIKKYGMHYTYTRELITFSDDVTFIEDTYRNFIELILKAQEYLLQIAIFEEEDVCEIIPDAIGYGEETKSSATDASSPSDIKGDTDDGHFLTLKDLEKLSTKMKMAGTPIQSEIMAGSSFSNTRPVGATRFLITTMEGVAYLKTLKTNGTIRTKSEQTGSSTFKDAGEDTKDIKKQFGKNAFIPVSEYAYNNLVPITKPNGKSYYGVDNMEVGTIGDFRVIEYQDQLVKFAAEASGGKKNSAIGIVKKKSGTSFLEKDTIDTSSGTEHYIATPFVTIAPGAFSGIGLNDTKDFRNYVANPTEQMAQRTRFSLMLYHRPPRYTPSDADQAYGRLGFFSSLWWSGFVFERPEQIGIIWAVVPKIF